MEENKNDNQIEHDKSSAVSSISSVGSFIWDLVKILVIALVIIIPFRMLIAEPFVVSGSSMQPNYQNHDYLIIDRLTYIKNVPQRGDIVVLKFPKDTSQFFIKRIIGLPGETIKISQGYVTVFNNQFPEGFRLNETYLSNQSETFGQTNEVRLGSGEYFVLGDNRTASSDSRVWGILPANGIVGKVWARVYPFATAGFFKAPNY